MKRQAAKQLAKDDDDEEEVEETPGQGFKKADESVLATRVIRGLPKRAGATPENGRVSEDTAAKKNPLPLFAPKPPSESGSFKFETSSSPQITNPSSSPFSGFSFKPTADASKPTSTPTNSIFSTTSSTSFTSTPLQPISSFVPSPNPFSSGASTATNTSKTFASLLSTPSTSSKTLGSPFLQGKSSTPNGSTLAESTPDDSVPTKFYTNLRGLNVSLLSAISKELESDPFVDISTFLEKYLSLRSKIQKEYDDESSENSKSKPPADTSTAKKPAMPAPPTSFAGFGGLKNPTSAPTTTDPKPNLFDFKSSGSSNPANPFAPVKDSTTTSSTFGGSPFSSQTTSSATAPSAFTLGSSSDKAPANSSPFGTFGASAPSANFTIGSSSSNQSSSSPPKSVFGPSTTSPFTFGSNSSNPASSNVFGNVEKAPSTPSAFQIPPKDTTKNPVQFGFGSYTTGSSPFGAKATAESAAPTEEKQTEGDNSDRGTPTVEGDPATANLIASGPNPHDEEGEGEENEETAHSIKAKAYKLTKTDEEGGAKWVIMGAGILRLKKDKDTGARRMLLRNSTNGKVIMNFSIYSGLKPTQTKAALSFVGHDAGVSQTYSVRLPNEEDAKQLKGALDREIAFVKAKEEV